MDCPEFHENDQWGSWDQEVWMVKGEREAVCPHCGYIVKLTKKEDMMREGVRRYLRALGYYVLFDSDLGGGSYFDCIAIGENDIGAIELKLSDWKKVVAQARRRLHNVNWAVILMPSLKALEKIQENIKTPSCYPEIGLWHFDKDRIMVVREHETFEPWQKDHHTMTMIRKVMEAKKRGLDNVDVWGHKRGISLMGLLSPFQSMYGRKGEGIGQIPPKNLPRGAPFPKRLGRKEELPLEVFHNGGEG